MRRFRMVDAKLGCDGQNVQEFEMAPMITYSVQTGEHLPDYEQAVTDVACPLCSGGIIRWAEAGYMPGYRVCDKCGKHFLARGSARNPTLLRYLDRQGGSIAESIQCARRRLDAELAKHHAALVNAADGKPMVEIEDGLGNIDQYKLSPDGILEHRRINVMSAVLEDWWFVDVNQLGDDYCQVAAGLNISPKNGVKLLAA